MIREHKVKCHAAQFSAVRTREKTFEVRRDDRGYQRGDYIILREYDPTQLGVVGREPGFTGEEERREIVWILTGGQYGVEPGYVVLSLK